MSQPITKVTSKSVPLISPEASQNVKKSLKPAIKPVEKVTEDAFQANANLGQEQQKSSENSREHRAYGEAQKNKLVSRTSLNVSGLKPSFQKLPEKEQTKQSGRGDSGISYSKFAAAGFVVSSAALSGPIIAASGGPGLIAASFVLGVGVIGAAATSFVIKILTNSATEQNNANNPKAPSSNRIARAGG